jgi:hypothetical protein
MEEGVAAFIDLPLRHRTAMERKVGGIFIK